ncbi:transport and Golgi organization protein 1 homolog [Callospermophilus lateralis]
MWHMEQLQEEIKRLNRQLAQRSSLNNKNLVSERERVLLEELEALKQLSFAGREKLCCELHSSSTQTQLQQEVKDWSASHTELSEQIKSFEKFQKDLLVALNHKDDTINALTNYITQLNRLQCESESEDQNREDESDELTNGEVAGDRNEKIKDQIKQMMDVSGV